MALLPEAGTDEINGHPINFLWADKTGSLAGIDCGGVSAHTYGRIDDEVKKLLG